MKKSKPAASADTAADPQERGTVTFQIFTRAKNKPLTKTIGLVDGKPGVIGTDTAMSNGTSESITAAWPHGVAEAIGAARSSQALAPSNAPVGSRIVVAKDMLPRFEEAFARLEAHYPYVPGPALVLIDADDTSPTDTADMRWEFIASLCPAFASAGRVITHSVSSFLALDGEITQGEGNKHIYLCVLDATDIERAMDALFVRAWIAGKGRIKIGVAGQMLKRGPFDASVFQSNRLCFEGAPVIVEPRVTSLRPPPTVIDGPMLDTRAAIPDLTDEERGNFDSLIAVAKVQYRSPAEKAKRQHEAVQVEVLIERGIEPKQAREIVASRVVGGTLAREDVIYTSGKGTVTVGDILADLEAFDGVRCADPAEPAYPHESGPPSTSRAIIYANLPDGVPLIYSHAHGGQVFHLRPKRGSHEAERATLESLRAMDEPTFAVEWPATLASLAVDQREGAIKLVQERAGKGKAPIKERIKQEIAKLKAKAADEKLKQYLAGRTLVTYTPDDTDAQALKIERLVIKAAEDGEWFQFGDALAAIGKRTLPGSHAVDDASGQPPEVPVIVAHDTASVVRMIERAVCLVEKNAQGKASPIEVPPTIIRQTLKRKVLIAPAVNGLVTHPFVRFDGEVVTKCGLDAASGLYVAHNLGEIEVARLNAKQAKAALQRLKKVFLAGFEFPSPLDRDAAIYLLLTGLMRKLLDEAPMGSIEASVQQSGKTTLARKLHVTLTGHDMPTFSLPTTEEEMRKLLTTALMHSPPMICFDNVEDGSTVASPTLSKVVTGATHQDRLLGVNREVIVPTNTLIVLTGNNLLRGADEATRVVQSRLTSSKINPADRKYPDRDVMMAALRDRPAVLADALGILSGYLSRHGMKDAPDGFRAFRWAASVFGAMLWAGGENVATRTRALMDSAKSATGVGDLVGAIHKVFGEKPWAISDLIEEPMTFGGDRSARLALQGVLEVLTKTRNGPLTKQSVLAQVSRYLGVPATLEDGSWAIEAAVAADKRTGALYQVCRRAE